MNNTIFGLLCIALTAMCIGCGKNQSQNQSSKGVSLQLHQGRLSPSTLFNKNTKLLEPHLGISSGAVQIEYAGPEQWISYGCEIWRNGEIAKQVSWGAVPYLHHSLGS